MRSNRLSGRLRHRASTLSRTILTNTENSGAVNALRVIVNRFCVAM